MHSLTAYSSLLSTRTFYCHSLILSTHLLRNPLFTHSLTYLSTQSLTHSFIYLLHILTHSLTHKLTDPLTPPPLPRLILSLLDHYRSLTATLTPSQVFPLPHLLFPLLHLHVSPASVAPSLSPTSPSRHHQHPYSPTCSLSHSRHLSLIPLFPCLSPMAKSHTSPQSLLSYLLSFPLLLISLSPSAYVCPQREESAKQASDSTRRDEESNE